MVYNETPSYVQRLDEEDICSGIDLAIANMYNLRILITRSHLPWREKVVSRTNTKIRFSDQRKYLVFSNRKPPR